MLDGVVTMTPSDLQRALELAREVQRLNAKRTQGEWFHDQRGWIVAVPDESRPSEEFEVMTDGGECTTSDGPFVALVTNSAMPIVDAFLTLAAERERMVKENFDLRTAVIDVCDRRERLLMAQAEMSRIRAAANKLDVPFDYASALTPPAALDAQGKGES